MADNNAEFTKKILVDVELSAEQIKKDLPALIGTINNYKKEVKDLTDANKLLEKSTNDLSKQAKETPALYAENTKKIQDNYREITKNNTKIAETSTQLRQLKGDLREANKYIDNVSKAIYAETGSIQQNRAILSLVTGDYVKLGQAENQTAASTEKMAADINQLTNVLKEQEIKIGQTYRNVGNYTESINKSNIALQKASSGMQIFGAATETVRKGIGFMPSDIGGATSALGKLNGVFGTVQTAVTAFNVGFRTQSTIIKEARDAELNLAKAKEIVMAATLAEEAAQEALTTGTGTSIAVQAAAIEKEEAQTAALTAQAIATEAASAATGMFTNVLRVLKMALLSSGIGAIVLALGALAEYFGNTNEGAKEFEVLTTRAGASLDVFKGKVADLGRTLFKYGEGVDDVDEKQKKTFGNKGIELLSKFLMYTQAIVLNITGISYALAKVNNSKVVKDAGAAADEAERLVRARQALTIKEREYNNTTKIELTNELAVQRARIRNLHYTTAERQAAAEKAKKIANDLYETDKKYALESQRIIEGQQELKRKAGVRVDKVAIAEAKGRLLTLKGQHDRELEMLDAREARVDKMAETAAQKAKRLKEKKEAEEKKAYDDSEQIRTESIAREMQDIYEAYGDQVIAANVQYSQQLNKLKKFLTDKRITQEQFNIVAGQLESEHASHIGKIIDNFNRQDIERVRQAANELKNIQIQSIQNDAERNIESLKERGYQQQDAIDKQSFALLRNMDKLKTEIDQLKGEEQAEAQRRYDADVELLRVNGIKKVELARQTAQDIARINKNALDQQNKLKDGNDTNAAVTKFGANSAQALAARQQALLDNYNAEVSNEALTAAAKLEIERKYLADRDALERQSRNNKIELSVQAEQAVQSGVFDLLSQGLQQGSEKILAELDARKSAELENNSLTNTQKRLIEQKYAKLEKTEKEKAFKANQKLQVANILINGAVGISKTIAEMGFLPAIPFVALTAASTAFSIAKVLSAKPGFAKGGQFESDGRGAMLPGYSKTDNTNARLRSGEAVVVSEAMRVPWARNAVSSINEMFGGRAFGTGQYRNPFVTPGFATGGVFTDGGNANRYYSAPVYDSEGLANSLAYQLINNFPPIVADIKDIISQQAIKIQTDNRVNL